MITDEFHVYGDTPHGWTVMAHEPAPTDEAVRYSWLAYYGGYRVGSFITGDSTVDGSVRLEEVTAERAIKRAKEEHQFLLENADKIPASA